MCPSDILTQLRTNGPHGTLAKAVVTTKIPLRLYSNSTALRSFNDLRHDCRPTCVGCCSEA